MRTLSIIYLHLLLFVLIPCGAATAQSSWYTPLNFGLLPTSHTHNSRFDDVYFISHDTGILVSSYGMIFKTYDGAEHWALKKVAGPVYFRSVEFSADGQVGIAGTLSGLIFRSNDRGETWDDISASITDTGLSAKRICGLAHYGNNFYGVGWWGAQVARFYKSTDAGITWATTYIDTGLVSGLVDITFLTANKGFVTGFHTYDQGHKQESVVLRTLDGGSTWTKVFSDTAIAGGIWKIQFIDNDFGVGSIEPAYSDTVAMIKTTDGGNTWQIMPVGHKPTYAYGTQGIGFLNRQKGWIGGYYSGMFETNDGGLTWDTLAVNDECDRFFLVDSTMYVSANTVYKYGSRHTEQIGEVPALSFMHKLYPVAPNPANGRVQISFDINTHQTNTVLEVVCTDGRRTYPVMNDYLKPGHYIYEWDGTNAPAGNYIVWLGTDEIPMIEKFVLRK